MTSIFAELEDVLVDWDGRLDNAPELAVSLGMEPNEALPASLALAVYRKRGVAGLEALIGDWSLAIVFPKDCLTILAVDYAAFRPLYYRVRGTGVAWARSIDQLTESVGASDLDPNYISDLLCVAKSVDRSPYKGNAT